MACRWKKKRQPFEVPRPQMGCERLRRPRVGGECDNPSYRPSLYGRPRFEAQSWRVRGRGQFVSQSKTRKYKTVFCEAPPLSHSARYRGAPLRGTVIVLRNTRKARKEDWPSFSWKKPGAFLTCLSGSSLLCRLRAMSR